MSPLEIVFVTLVVIAVGLTAFFIRTSGIGFGARSVICPHKGCNAAISTRWTTVNRESKCEVLQCSLVPGGKPVTCDMSCIAQL